MFFSLPDCDSELVFSDSKPLHSDEKAALKSLRNDRKSNSLIKEEVVDYGVVTKVPPKFWAGLKKVAIRVLIVGAEKTNTPEHAKSPYN